MNAIPKVFGKTYTFFAYPESERGLCSNFILEAHLQDRRGGSCYLGRSKCKGTSNASEESDDLEHCYYELSEKWNCPMTRDAEKDTSTLRGDTRTDTPNR